MTLDRYFDILAAIAISVIVIVLVVLGVDVSISSIKSICKHVRKD